MKTSKKLLFSLISLFLFIVSISLIEFGLRILIDDSKDSFTEPVTYDNIEWLKINRSYLQRYFSKNDPLIPELKPSLIRKTKQSNTFRIVCLGGSTMFGVPYQMNANISGIVRKQLRNIYPQMEFEVVNLGASAINTNVILHIIPEVLKLQPDLILLYTGHNEFYGPEGVGASWIEKIFPWFTQWKYDLRALAIAKSIDSFFSDQTSQRSSIDANLMKQVSQGSHIPLNSKDAQIVFSKFESNLSSILSSFQSHSVPVILSDVTSNDQFPPFVFEPDDRFTQAAAMIQKKQFSEASKLLNSVVHDTPDNAMTYFLLGQAYEGLEQYDSAKQYFRLSRDNDLLKFRAPSRINQIIHSVGNVYHTPLISSDSVFTRYSPHGISSQLLFWEHLHPNLQGYFLIANEFISSIRQNKFLPASTMPNIPFNLDSLEICAIDLAFGDYTIKNLTSKWPFRDYHVRMQVYPTLSPAQQMIVQKLFRVEMVWDEGCYESAQLFWREGRFQDAITTYRAVLEEYPFNFYAHYLLGSILNQTNHVDEAIVHYRQSISSNSYYPYSKVDLGLIMINSGSFDEAITLLNDALGPVQRERLTVLESTIYYGLGTAYANKRDFTLALSYAEKALSLSPSNRDAAVLRQKLEQISR